MAALRVAEDDHPVFGVDAAGGSVEEVFRHVGAVAEEIARASWPWNDKAAAVAQTAHSLSHADVPRARVKAEEGDAAAAGRLVPVMVECASAADVVARRGDGDSHQKLFSLLAQLDEFGIDRTAWRTPPPKPNEVPGRHQHVQLESVGELARVWESVLSRLETAPNWILLRLGFSPYWSRFRCPIGPTRLAVRVLSDYLAKRCALLTGVLRRRAVTESCSRCRSRLTESAGILDEFAGSLRPYPWRLVRRVIVAATSLASAVVLIAVGQIPASLIAEAFRQPDTAGTAVNVGTAVGRILGNPGIWMVLLPTALAAAIAFWVAGSMHFMAARAAQFAMDTDPDPLGSRSDARRVGLTVRFGGAYRAERAALNALCIKAPVDTPWDLLPQLVAFPVLSYVYLVTPWLYPRPTDPPLTTRLAALSLIFAMLTWWAIVLARRVRARLQYGTSPAASSGPVIEVPVWWSRGAKNRDAGKGILRADFRHVALCSDSTAAPQWWTTAELSIEGSIASLQCSPTTTDSRWRRRRLWFTATGRHSTWALVVGSGVPALLFVSVAVDGNPPGTAGQITYWFMATLASLVPISLAYRRIRHRHENRTAREHRTYLREWLGRQTTIGHPGE
jgi:hypothetical protein